MSTSAKSKPRSWFARLAPAIKIYIGSGSDSIESCLNSVQIIIVYLGFFAIFQTTIVKSKPYDDDLSARSKSGSCCTRLTPREI